MGEFLKWQEEVADLMRERCILESEFLYKTKKLNDEYHPKISALQKKIAEIYVHEGLIQDVNKQDSEVENGEVV